MGRSPLAEARHRITLNLKPEEFDMLNRMASNEGRTLANMAARAIRQFHAVVYSDESPKD
jgi:uncharacterized protein (DUF1778 family)